MSLKSLKSFFFFFLPLGPLYLEAYKQRAKNVKGKKNRIAQLGRSAALKLPFCWDEKQKSFILVLPSSATTSPEGTDAGKLLINTPVQDPEGYQRNLITAVRF